MADIRDPFAQMRQTLAPGATPPASPKPVSPMEWTAQKATTPTQPAPPTARDPLFATKALSPEAQQFRSTMAQGPTPPPGWTPPTNTPQMPSMGGLRRAAFGAGQTVGKAKDWAVGTADPAAKGFAGKAKDVGGRALQGLGRAFGVYNTADAFVKNVDGMSKVFGSDDATTSDKLAAGVEGAGNIIGTGMLNLSKAIPRVGPVISGMVGPNPASLLADTTGDSVLNRFNPNAGFGTTPVGKALAPTQPTKPAAANPAAATQPAAAQPQAVDPNAGPQGPLPHPDITKDLAKLPNLSFGGTPQGMREGFVYKTKDANGRTVYSGSNVKEGANMLDGQGNAVGQLRSAFGPESSGVGYNPDAGFNTTSAALSEARQAAADRGDWDAVAGSYDGRFAGAARPQAGGVRSSGPDMGGALRKSLEEMAASPRRRDRNAAAQIMVQLSEGADRNSVASRGQDLSYDSAVRGQDVSAQSSRYASDTQLAAKQMEIQRQQATRQAMAAAYQATGGKLEDMKKLMIANGYDPQIVEQSIAADNAATAANQAVQAKASDRVREDNRVFKDVDGKQVVDEEATQAKLDALRQVFGGTTTMDTDSYEKNAPKIKALGGIFDRARGDTNFGLGAYMPWADEPQRLSAMPNWKGAKLSKTSGLKGAFTTGGLEKGHYTLEHNGRELNLGHLDDLQRDLIEYNIATGLWTPGQTQK